MLFIWNSHRVDDVSAKKPIFTFLPISLLFTRFAVRTLSAAGRTRFWTLSNKFREQLMGIGLNPIFVQSKRDKINVEKKHSRKRRKKCAWNLSNELISWACCFLFMGDRSRYSNKCWVCLWCSCLYNLALTIQSIFFSFWFFLVCCPSFFTRLMLFWYFFMKWFWLWLLYIWMNEWNLFFLHNNRRTRKGKSARDEKRHTIDLHICWDCCWRDRLHVGYKMKLNIWECVEI